MTDTDEGIIPDGETASKEELNRHEPFSFQKPLDDEPDNDDWVIQRDASKLEGDNAFRSRNYTPRQFTITRPHFLWIPPTARY
jgi:hypothetical protein